MKTIDIQGMHFQTVNKTIRNAVAADTDSLQILHCMGQRYIAAGLSGADITIDGTPGNALGAYLNGAGITVNGSVQDAVGDTMNSGTIVVHGDAGDALGYAMRGGKIFIRGNSGYRTGVHMKQYKDKKPVIVVGGCTGSFLGEYQAGGAIVVLGLDADGNKITGEPVIGDFAATGIHGGKIFVRSDNFSKDMPEQISVAAASEEDLAEIGAYIKEFAQYFGISESLIMNETFYVLKPSSGNPYKKMYVAN